MGDIIHKIAMHWTVGTYAGNADDFNRYHMTIGQFGMRHPGRFPPEANKAPLGPNYVRHLGGGNTGCAGIAVRAMLGYKGPWNVGNYPITPAQAEALCAQVAKWCHVYDVPIDEDHVFTHYEFGLKHPGMGSEGKIDINFLPHMPKLKPHEVGPWLRNKVNWYYLKHEQGH